MQAVRKIAITLLLVLITLPLSANYRLQQLAAEYSSLNDEAASNEIASILEQNTGILITKQAIVSQLSKLYYTAISRLPSAEDGTVLQSSSSMEALFFYNKNGLLAKEQKKYKDRTETLLYYYDESGRKTKTSWLTEYPDGRKHYLEHAYIYEADGDYTKMTEYYSLRTKKVYTYNAKGNVSTIKLYEIYNIGGSDTAILTSMTEYAYN